MAASENRVWRLCSASGIFAAHSHRKPKGGRPGPAVHDDLVAVVDAKGVVRHDFTASAPNQVWLTDSVAALLPSRAPQRTAASVLP